MRGKRVIICAVSLCIILIWYFLVVQFKNPVLFGRDLDVLVASSQNIYSWYAERDQPCQENRETTLMFRYLDVKMICRRTTESCRVWNWDVANWTLIYTNAEMSIDDSRETRFCPVPIHGERTAKIINIDGSVEYPGCFNTNYPCSQTTTLFYAHYDKNVNQRINRSPCCRKLLIDVTHHMARIFDKYNITYFLVGGTVISLVRDNGRLIPYDTDTDVAVDARDVDKVDKALPELRKPGYIFEWRTQFSINGSKRYMTGCTNKHCLTGPGIAFYSIKQGLVTAPIKNWPSFPASLSIPPIRGKFEGLEMGFPKHPAKYLDFVYGKDKWLIPLNCTKKYDGQCKE